MPSTVLQVCRPEELLNPSQPACSSGGFAALRAQQRAAAGCFHLYLLGCGRRDLPASSAWDVCFIYLSLLQVDAQLGELAIFCGGREPSPWWPPEVRWTTLLACAAAISWQLQL